MAQQTAVEWLINAIDCVDIASGMKMHIHIPKCFIEQAKQMEKEQIMNAHQTADQYVWKSTRKEAAQQYYNETFGKE